MTRTCLVLATLALVLFPSAAEARYRIPSAPEVLGTSQLIVVGEVKSVHAGHYLVTVQDQVVGPKVALKGEIKVHRRPATRRCVPQDPSGIKAGTRWVWVLTQPADASQPYRSWVSAPFQVRLDSAKVARVHYFGVTPRGDQSAPSLKVFVALVKGYRDCYQVAPSGVAKPVASAEDLAAFRASSPYAGELVRRTPHDASPKPKPGKPKSGN